MSAANPVSAPPAHAPPAETADVHCPLCGYDLRAQVEPRCPECGYRFDWSELRDPARRLHPYLFEHHPQRNVRSFFQTLIGGFRPRQFWATLYPTQRSRPFRLALYFFVISLVGIVPAVANLGLTATEYRAGQERLRAQMLRDFQTPAIARWRQRFPANLTPQQIVDLTYPPRTWQQMLRYAWQRSGVRGIVYFQAPILLWPLLTLAAMMVFQFSMRRARVRAIHVVRCVVYSADVMLWINLVLGLALMLAALRRLNGASMVYGDAEPIYAVLVLIGWLFFAYRLTTALRLYLQFDHPKSTVLATQIIALLALLVLIVNFSI